MDGDGGGRRGDGAATRTGAADRRRRSRVNGKKWANVFPTDGLFDSKERDVPLQDRRAEAGHVRLVLQGEGRGRQHRLGRRGLHRAGEEVIAADRWDVSPTGLSASDWQECGPESHLSLLPQIETINLSGHAGHKAFPWPARARSTTGSVRTAPGRSRSWPSPRTSPGLLSPVPDRPSPPEQ